MNLNLEGCLSVLLMGSIRPIPSMEKQTTPKNLPASVQSISLKLGSDPSVPIFIRLAPKMVSTVVPIKIAAIMELVMKNLNFLIKEKGMEIKNAIR